MIREIIIKNQKGIILFIAMSFMALLVISAVSLSTMIQRDVKLIRRVKENEQARALAEAGINHAFAKMKENGFASRANFTGSLDTGSYSVTFLDVSGRCRVTSVGTVSGVSKTVVAEIKGYTATALNYFSGAGDDVMIKIHTGITDATINGDIHANDDVYLIGQPSSHLAITGDVSATGIVQEGSKHDQSDNKDTNIYINALNNDAATVYEGANRIIFPVFNYGVYKQAAIGSDPDNPEDYYSSDQTFTGTLSPTNGIVYVDGDVTISGTCTLNGGMIAESIYIPGGATLQQVKSGTRNVIIAKDSDITVAGRLCVGEAVVYAAQDIQTRENWGADVEINGCMLASRDIRMWNFRTSVNYNHVYILPPDMAAEMSGFSVVSWNR